MKFRSVFIAFFLIMLQDKYPDLQPILLNFTIGALITLLTDKQISSNLNQISYPILLIIVIAFIFVSPKTATTVFQIFFFFILTKLCVKLSIK